MIHHVLKADLLSKYVDSVYTVDNDIFQPLQLITSYTQICHPYHLTPSLFLFIGIVRSLMFELKVGLKRPASVS